MCSVESFDSVSRPRSMCVQLLCEGVISSVALRDPSVGWKGESKDKEIHWEGGAVF